MRRSFGAGFEIICSKGQLAHSIVKLINCHIQGKCRQTFENGVVTFSPLKFNSTTYNNDVRQAAL